ncbi:hypothetical protein N9Z96_00790 [bacterium]|nr:hypothetical protein [bacterium]
MSRDRIDHCIFTAILYDEDVIEQFHSQAARDQIEQPVNLDQVEQLALASERETQLRFRLQYIDSDFADGCREQIGDRFAFETTHRPRVVRRKEIDHYLNQNVITPAEVFDHCMSQLVVAGERLLMLQQGLLVPLSLR